MGLLFTKTLGGISNLTLFGGFNHLRRNMKAKKLIYGVGINDATYQVSDRSSGKEVRCPFYILWKNVLARCYSPAYQKNNTTYIGCSVDHRWYSFMAFRAWVETKDWKDKQLDKDILVLGNKVYGPDTCMFVDRKTNAACRSVTSYVIYKGFWVRLSEFCKDDPALYSYANTRVRAGVLDMCEIIAEREYNTSGKRVIWQGEDVALKDLCDEYGKDYYTVLNRLHTHGWSNSSLYACVIYDINPFCNYDMVTNDGVRYQFKSKDDLVEFTGSSITFVNMYFPECQNNITKLKELISNHERTDTRKLYVIDGLSKYKDDWLAFYENNDVRVSATMTRLGIPFVEAVKLPIQRVRKVVVNGETMLVKDLWVKYNIDPKQANNRKSSNNWTFKTTLSSYDIDTSHIKIATI